MSRASITRTIIRIFTALLAVIFSLDIVPDLVEALSESSVSENPLVSRIIGMPMGFLPVLLPAMSPFLAVSSSMGTRSLSPLALAAVPVLIMSLFRGRWFCRNICPMGLAAELAGLPRQRSKAKCYSWPRLGRWLLLIALGGAIAGYPLFLQLDPLVIFNGFINAWREPFTAAVFASGGLFAAILLLSLWRPNAWCFRICPLGAMQELLGRAFKALKNPGKNRASKAPGMDRRIFLGAAAGGVLGILMGKLPGSRRVIRPPGAVDENRFTALCARCGNCVGACPENIIRHDFAESGLGGLLTPVIAIGPGYCAEWCSECTKVCPTGAIERLSLEEKRCVSIGTAEVTRLQCLAWNEHQYCMVCSEYCPYGAISDIRHEGVNCPEVESDICRGCGLCQTVCPAEKTAINVRARDEQVTAKNKFS
ncbi:MAG: 4Fe-4S binding protein [Kiritimatiellia bacterium]